jgi:signal transduction histidine kinase
MSTSEEVYQEALQSWLWQRSEAALSVAYEVGRSALNDGVGILDLLELHKNSLERLGQGSPSLASAFGNPLFELVSPFEMTFTGYQQTNGELRRLNETLERQKRQLEVANQDLEAFSYSISHDLRAPVRRLLGFSRVLANHQDLAQLSPEVRRYLEAIVTCGTQMEEMIEALLTLSRLSQEQLSAGRVNLSQLAQTVFEEMKAANPAAQLEVQPDMQEVLDVPLFRLVLQNLIGNALKFTSTRSQPVIRFGISGQDYFLSDNGVGFNEAYQDRLFKPFQRLHSAKEFEGSGIGLATVQRIIERHGGRVWAQSELGVGSTFFFRLWLDR